MTFTSLTSATAFAPATVANVCAGFDVLGFAFEVAGDHVTVTRDATIEGVVLESIGGCVPELPLDVARNTATVALLAAIDLRRPSGGFRVALHKGIPLGSGMGGSAASAVGAVVAVSALLEPPLSAEELLRCALEGERVASGAAHADNVAPCIHGGLTAAVGGEPPRVVSVPVPRDVVCALVHPHLRVDTRRAREVLPRELPLTRHVHQSMYLAGFLLGCCADDLQLAGSSMVDLVAEPARSALIPGFAAARAAALAAGALGFGIAGSGPSVFAWTSSIEIGRRVEAGVRRAFQDAGLAADGWVGPLATQGARRVASPPAAAVVE
jgi:homoserine kinase